MLVTAVVTVAFRGAWSSRPRSPKHSPGPSRTTSVPSRWTTTLPVDHDVERMRGSALHHDVDPGGNGQICDAEASCSSTSCGTPCVIGSFR